MTTTTAFVPRLVAVCITGLTLLAVGCSDDPTTPLASDVVDGVYTPTSTPFGKSYADWSAEWWKWVMQTPATDAAGNVVHPLLDTTGARGSAGQPSAGSVYFVAGAFMPGTYTRNITVPAGKALLVPVINKWTDTTGNWNTDSMRTSLDRFAGEITSVTVQIDGRSIADVTSYRFRTGLFSVTLPDYNVYQLMGLPLARGTVMPMMAEGYWIMLAPLPTGTHTLRFIGRSSKFTVDVTDHITVQ